jgi:hypothetical protein
MFSNSFPEKGSSMEERKAHKPLKKEAILPIFPEKAFSWERRFFSCALSVMPFLSVSVLMLPLTQNGKGGSTVIDHEVSSRGGVP